jgi:prepilin-type N-terminal cleavage/methylation domain-containing protein
MKNNKGFTLIELLVSISIIAILSVVLAVSFSSAQKNGRDQRRISDIKAIQNAAEQYYMLSGAYPLSTSYTPGTNWSVGTQSILESYPVDPKNTSPYIYNRTATSTSYCVCAALEKTTSGNSSNNSCAFVASGAYFCVKNQQ